MSSGDESTKLKAGHPPAVKAGGMRITQHKEGHGNKTPKEVVGDVTGLSGPSNIPVNPTTVGGAPAKNATEFVLEAAQVAHTPKPPAVHAQKPHGNIHQPRK
ncbi:death-associated protein 1 [Arctopsyche grandis]|uniref:death-associated protein 1 n=1 Tax=Arctopsyche grandis TaxID=121162 RepID=UPI00406D7F43